MEKEDRGWGEGEVERVAGFELGGGREFGAEGELIDAQCESGVPAGMVDIDDLSVVRSSGGGLEAFGTDECGGGPGGGGMENDGQRP